MISLDDLTWELNRLSRYKVEHDDYASLFSGGTEEYLDVNGPYIKVTDLKALLERLSNRERRTSREKNHS